MVLPETSSGRSVDPPFSPRIGKAHVLFAGKKTNSCLVAECAITQSHDAGLAQGPCPQPKLPVRYLCDNMASSKYPRTLSVTDLFPEVVRAGFAGDRSALENATATAIRLLRSSDPLIASKLAEIFGAASAGSASLRWTSSEPPPADSESGASLVKIIASADAPEPTLPRGVEETVKNFLSERQASARLLSEGILPPRTMMLTGEPGTGKTMLARWLAAQLGTPLVVLDLSAAMSSYLGKTGSNLRRSLDFARSQVLLQDAEEALTLPSLSKNSAALEAWEAAFKRHLDRHFSGSTVLDHPDWKQYFGKTKLDSIGKRKAKLLEMVAKGFRSMAPQG